MIRKNIYVKNAEQNEVGKVINTKRANFGQNCVTDLISYQTV